MPRHFILAHGHIMRPGVAEPLGGIDPVGECESFTDALGGIGVRLEKSFQHQAGTIGSVPRANVGILPPHAFVLAHALAFDVEPVSDVAGHAALGELLPASAAFAEPLVLIAECGLGRCGSGRRGFRCLYDRLQPGTHGIGTVRVQHIEPVAPLDLGHHLAFGIDCHQRRCTRCSGHTHAHIQV